MKNCLKIVIVGPQKSGKTTFANLLATTAGSTIGTETKPDKKSDTTSEAHRRPYETSLLRILRTTTTSTQVELWDVSGNHTAYQHLWKPIMQGIDANGNACNNARVDGVILVVEHQEQQGSSSHHSQESIMLWYDKFVRECNVPDKCCLVVVCRRRSNDDQSIGRSSSSVNVGPVSMIPRQLQGCRVRFTNLENEEEAKNMLEDLVKDIIASSMRR